MNEKANRRIDMPCYTPVVVSRPSSHSPLYQNYRPICLEGATIDEDVGYKMAWDLVPMLLKGKQTDMWEKRRKRSVQSV